MITMYCVWVMTPFTLWTYVFKQCRIRDSSYVLKQCHIVIKSRLMSFAMPYLKITKAYVFCHALDKSPVKSIIMCNAWNNKPIFRWNYILVMFHPWETLVALPYLKINKAYVFCHALFKSLVKSVTMCNVWNNKVSNNSSDGTTFL